MLHNPADSPKAQFFANFLLYNPANSPKAQENAQIVPTKPMVPAHRRPSNIDPSTRNARRPSDNGPDATTPERPSGPSTPAPQQRRPRHPGRSTPAPEKTGPRKTQRPQNPAPQTRRPKAYLLCKMYFPDERKILVLPPSVTEAKPGPARLKRVGATTVAVAPTGISMRQTSLRPIRVHSLPIFP